MHEDELNNLSGKIIGACIEVHRELGPGLMEFVYVDCLCHELKLMGLSFVREVPVPVRYKGIEVRSNLRADILVENEIIVEVKAVNKLNSLFEAQLMTYLKLAHKELGLLINFNVNLLKEGLHRVRINHGTN
ncbi:MAG TPA: GxxExxY protein [Candidatus Cloacimonadota bacterium]|nr:GxxExxY protein [Candidatus Cloacimonadota bacterium]